MAAWYARPFLFPEHELIEQGALANPTAFGASHKKQIRTYLRICNLQYLSFEKAKKALQKSLQAKDHLTRYWALVACLSFGERAQTLQPEVLQILEADDQLINQFYAAAFFGYARRC